MMTVGLMRSAIPTESEDAVMICLLSEVFNPDSAAFKGLMRAWAQLAMRPWPTAPGGRCDDKVPTPTSLQFKFIPERGTRCR